MLSGSGEIGAVGAVRCLVRACIVSRLSAARVPSSSAVAAAVSRVGVCDSVLARFFSRVRSFSISRAATVDGRDGRGGFFPFLGIWPPSGRTWPFVGVGKAAALEEIPGIIPA